jgi:putative ATP-dependent endonuclease of the OLD family
MRLKTAQIRNFRGLRDLEIELTSTTLLIGENNCGKTSLIDAIRIAMSRTAGRKTGTFDPYDYHLDSHDAEPQGATPISITLTFETEDGENLPDEFTQILGDVLVLDAAGKSLLIFRVTSAFDATVNDFVSDWHFLDATGDPLGPKSKRPTILQDFQRLFPVFYLSALRDAVREFRTGSFWTPFIKNPAIPPELKEQLQEQINGLNKAVLDAHSSLKIVKTHLLKIQEVVPLGKADAVDIEALPGRISDLLTGTQVNVSASSGAYIPLVRHGANAEPLCSLPLSGVSICHATRAVQ